MATVTEELDPTASLAGSTARKRSGKKLLRAALAIILLTVAAPLSLVLRPLVSSNLGIVDPGKVIRAAQPTTGLSRLIKDHHLASILNLRGGSSKDWWYTAEIQAAEAGGVAFFDFPMNATRRPSRRELLTLLEFFDHCQYPLLIHCKAGADRTGLASALYLMMQRNEPPREALQAFTLCHGHIPLFGTERLHEPIDEYARWLESQGLTHTPQRFREWVKKEFQSADSQAEPLLLIPGPRKLL